MAELDVIATRNMLMLQRSCQKSLITPGVTLRPNLEMKLKKYQIEKAILINIVKIAKKISFTNYLRTSVEKNIVIEVYYD